MKFVFLYLSGIIFGVLFRNICNIIFKAYINEVRETGILFSMSSRFFVCNIILDNEINQNHRKNRKRIIIRIIIRSVCVLAIMGIVATSIVLIIKYGLWGKIKSIAVYIFGIAEKIFIFFLGLCTPYLTKRTTKKLNKMRKQREKRKKKQRKKKNKDMKRINKGKK